MEPLQYQVVSMSSNKYTLEDMDMSCVIHRNFELMHLYDKNPTVSASRVRSGLGGDTVFYFYGY